MLSKFFGTDKFLDLLGTPKFWYTMAILIGFIVLLVFAIKHWSSGGKFIFIALFILVFSGLTIYSGVQLNYYYSAEGGLHGVISGIFNTNELEVVDDLTFKLDNIELTLGNDNTYSATLTTDKVVSLSTRNNLGVFINGVPCTSADIHNDYVVAEYTYTFFDNNKEEILTDTLMLNFAFYDNSTLFKLSTSGSPDAVYLWNSYFNKNGFVVKIAEYENVLNESLEFGVGNVSEYPIVTYMLDNEVVGTQAYVKGSKIELLEIEQEHLGWKLNNVSVSTDYIVTEDIVIKSIAVREHKVSIIFPDAHYVVTEYVKTGNCIEHSLVVDGSTTYGYDYRIIVDYWTINGKRVNNIRSYVVTEDIEVAAVYHTDYKVELAVNGKIYFSDYILSGSIYSISLPTNFDLEYIKDKNSNIVTDRSFVINDGLYLNAIGTYNTHTLRVYTQGGYNTAGGYYELELANFSTITLEIPYKDNILYKDYKFVEWRIVYGDGVINGNEFTLGCEDSVIYAVYDYIDLQISSADGSFFYVFKDDACTDAWGYVDKYSVISPTISGNSVSFVLGGVIDRLDTDGVYTIETLDNGFLKLSFTDASFIYLHCKRV